VHQLSERHIYFKNLNAIRFIAAAMVICHHIEFVKSHFNMPNHYENNNMVIQAGRSGVVLFFVLSGFLITFLLLKEEEITQTIAIKKFYLRRIFRIWPLYYLIILLAFIVLPNIPFFQYPNVDNAQVWSNPLGKTLLYMAILPNIATSIYGSFPFSSQTWSIGAEEQFYLIWPVLIKKIKQKWILLFWVIVTYAIVKYIILFQFQRHPTSNTWFMILGIWQSTPINCMAIGGIFSLIIFQKTELVLLIRKIIFNRVLQALVILFTALLLVIGYKSAHFNDEIYALLFGIIICNMAANDARLFSLEFSFLNYLGKISYGLYMYHNIFIVLSIAFLIKFNLFNSYLHYLLVFVFTIFMATISYEFFEKRFINKKIKYTTVSSG
jgi:peptidoglycan/LPS O-acetylase OafA/YrhL